MSRSTVAVRSSDAVRSEHTSRSPLVSIVPTGSANLASVRVAFQRLGCRVELIEAAERIESTRALILPGVGAFAAAMHTLRERGWDRALISRLRAGRPTLSICLGMQLLCASSAESDGCEGLGFLPGRIERLPDRVRVPQLGWNRVEAPPELGFESGHAYFANSYALRTRPHRGSTAWTDHGGRFVSAWRQGRMLACQFHPELSGAWGRRLLRSWLEQAYEDRRIPSAKEAPRC